jgi:hypothetical protein
MNCLVVVDTSCSGCCCWLINNAFCSWIKKVVVVVVLVLDNNNKNAKADPSTLFRRLLFDSFENVTQLGRIVILLRASLGGNKYRYFTHGKVVPNDGTTRKNGSCWNLILLVGMNCLVVVGASWLGVGTPIFVFERWLHDGR